MANRPVPRIVYERGFLADRPPAIAVLTKIFLDEIERLLCAAAGVMSDSDAPTSAHPRLGGVSFLHCFGSALNHHVHLHACVTDGVFVPAAAEAGGDTPPTFLPARPISQSDLAALTERVQRRVIRWFRLTRLLDASTSAGMRQEAAAGGHGATVPPQRLSGSGRKPTKPRERQTGTRSAPTREQRHRQGGTRRFGEPTPDGRHAQSRCSRAVRQPEDRCRSAIDRAIL